VGGGAHDSELEALKAGDEAAFTALIQRFHGPMLRLAMAYVRDNGVAEEVVQEAWLTCLRSLDRFEGRSSLKTWILGIVMNLARARRRKESRILPFASLWRRDDSDRERPTVDESKVLGDEALRRVRSAIEGLPPKQREVIVLRDVAGLDAGEVSGMLGISPENERVRLHRARAAVRKMLEDYLR
jgi:RNA polymerase sigma-70 factor (ECF subfamily)